MRQQSKILILLFTLCLGSITVLGHGDQSLQAKAADKEAAKIFLQIEEGIKSGNIELFSNYFGDKTYLSLGNGYAGYFSSSQAYYVLKDFLGAYTPLNFKLTSKVTDTNSPFASGVLRYSIRGVRSSAMVFISLKKINERWTITQITIN